MSARRGKSKKNAVDRHAYDPAILHAKVIRLATDSTGNGNASQIAPKGIDAELVERLSKILDIAKQPGTSEDEAKCALRLIARMLSSDDEKKAEVMSLDSAQEELQKSGHSLVKISRRDGKCVAVEAWIHNLVRVFKLAFNVRYFHTGKGSRECITVTYYGLQTKAATAAMSFEAIFNLALIWAANNPSKNCYLLGLSSSMIKSTVKEIELEEIRALESEKRLIESLHSSTIKIKKEQVLNPGLTCSLKRSGAITDAEEDDITFVRMKQEFKHSKKYRKVKKENEDEWSFKIKQEDEDREIGIAKEKQLKFEQKLEEEIETSGWQNHAKLMAFRQMAIRSAEEYFAKEWKGTKLKKYKSYRGDVQDFSAYKKGKKDAKKVDIKRRRLEAA